MVDGPIQYDIIDKNTYIPKLITKYGKEFSIVEIPYSFKLLMQELTSMNVQMRLITADNIEQLTKLGERKVEIEEDRPVLKDKSKNKNVYTEQNLEEAMEFYKTSPPAANNGSPQYTIEYLNPEVKKRITADWKAKEIEEYLESFRPTEKELVEFVEDYTRGAKTSILNEDLEQRGAAEVYKDVLRTEIRKEIDRKVEEEIKMLEKELGWNKPNNLPNVGVNAANSQSATANAQSVQSVQSAQSAQANAKNAQSAQAITSVTKVDVPDENQNETSSNQSSSSESSMSGGGDLKIIKI